MAIPLSYLFLPVRRAKKKKHYKSSNTKQGEVEKISRYVKLLQVRELLNITLVLQQVTKAS